jgi:hypothetical protein
MFNFFKRWRAGAPKTTSEPEENVGHKMVDAMLADLDGFMDSRARPTTEGFFDLFQGTHP